MQLTNVETTLLILALVLPGFLTVSVFRLIVPAKELSDQRGILSYLAFSTINYALFGWVLWLGFQQRLFEYDLVLAILLWLFVFFLAPLTLGLLLGFVWQRDIHRRLASKIGIRITHPIPNSWDYMFGSIIEPAWLLVTLTDERQVAGFFGTRSFASSDVNERDIFVEQVYKVDSAGAWHPDDPGKGLWIPQREIKLITIWQRSE